MRRLRAWFVRLADIFKKSKLERELIEEIEANLRLQIDDNIRSGMTPEDARREARLKFGSLDGAKEACRDRRGIPFLETLVRDVSYALRMLRQNKGWTAVAMLSLALGIGANSALFALVEEQLLRKLPIPNSNELVVFRWVGENNIITNASTYTYTGDDGQTMSFRAFEELRRNNKTLSGIFAFAPVESLNVFAANEAEFVRGQLVSGDFYGTLGVPAIKGRTLGPDDDSDSADPVAVISYQYWRRRFASDPEIAGRTITVNSVPFTIVGVTPSSVADLVHKEDAAPDVSLPLSMEPRIRSGQTYLRTNSWWLVVMGRRASDVPLANVEANLEASFQRASWEGWSAFVASLPAERRAKASDGKKVPRLRAVDASRGVTDSEPKSLGALVLLGAIFGIALLVVCVNVANLMLSRYTARQTEIAIRVAIGASRAQVIRQLLTESILLSVCGGVLGLLAALVFRSVVASTESPLSLELSWPVFGFASAVTMLTGLVFGIIPAIHATRVDLPAIRKGGGKFSSSRSLLGRSLLVGQVALSLVLVIGAGLFVRTLLNLQRVDIGFNPSNIALFTVEPALNGYDRPGAASLYTQLEERLLRTPGVRSVASSAQALLSGGRTFGTVTIEGVAPDSPLNQIEVTYLSVDHNFIDTMGIQLKLGRKLTVNDGLGSAAVAVVNDAFAKTFFEKTNPIGSRLLLEGNARIEIVGVVADTKIDSLREAAPPMVFRPLTQRGSRARTFVVRTAGDSKVLLPGIRAAVRDVDPRLPVRRASTQMDAIGNQYLSLERLFAFSLTIFGSLTLVIAMIGLFGLMSYSVASRTKEIGVRMALGARSDTVLRSVMRESLLLVGMGVAIGIAGTLALTRLISSLLFGLAPHDPLTILTAVALVLLVSTLAGYLPARRASRVDPMEALRYE